MQILTHWGRDKKADIFQTTFFKCIFLNENVSISIKIPLKFVPKGPALVQIMAWHRPGNKPLSESMMVVFPTHIYASPGPSELKEKKHHWSEGYVAYRSAWLDKLMMLIQ